MESINRIQGLIESAKPTLRRGGPPAISYPEVFSSIEDFDSYNRDPINKTASKIKAFADQGRVKSYGVTAEEVLTQALEIPKEIPSNYEKYFTNNYKLATMVEGFVKDQRFGRKAQQGRRGFYSPLSQFCRAAESWKKAIYNRGSLWESGIIIEGEEGIHSVSLSYPWDGSGQTWYERLTPLPILVDRKEVGEILEFITGKTREELELAGAFSADDLRVWWNQARLSNKIIKGSWAERKMKMRPYFEERMRTILERRVPSREFYEAVENATRIYGYFVTAQESSFPGAVDLKLHLDEDNWIEKRKPREVGQKESVEGGYEYMKKNRPAEEKMWVYEYGVLFNGKESSNPERDFSVYIELRDGLGNLPQNLPVEIVRYLNLNGLRRVKYYYINNPRFGDGATFSRLPMEGTTEPLKRKDYQRMLDLFLAARERGEVDSATFWAQTKTVGLTSETIEILDKVEKILREKLENSPSD